MADGKTLVLRIFEMVNSGDFGAAEELLQPGYVEHSPPFGDLHGVDGFKQVVTAFRTAFPDLRVRPVDIVQEGELVAWRTTGTGTHSGPPMDVPPTGRQVRFSGVDMGRMEGGKAAEHWSGNDNLGLLQQLGVVPPMGPGAG